MTYNVFSMTLNPTHFTHSLHCVLQAMNRTTRRTTAATSPSPSSSASSRWSSSSSWSTWWVTCSAWEPAGPEVLLRWERRRYELTQWLTSVALSVDAETVQNGLFGFITQNQLKKTAAAVMVHYDGCSSDIYIGWQWRNFFISAVFRHFVGQDLRNVCCADVSRRHFLNKVAIVRTFS